MTLTATRTYDYAAQPKEPVLVCPLCGEANPSRFATDRYGFCIGVSICLCGFQYVNPRLTASAYAEFYAEWYRPLVAALPIYADWSAAKLNDERPRLIRGRDFAAMLPAWGVTSVDHLLDVGGSTGAVARGLQQHLPVRVITVLDPCAAELQTASLAGLTTILGTAEDALPLSSHYDGILCTQTADHWCDPLAALRWMRSMLAPGGWLVIDIVDTPYWRRHVPPEHAWKIDHPLYWTVETLHDALKQTGWQPLHQWRSLQQRHHVGYFCRGAQRMATRIRGRRAAYDNIAAGSATGIERTIAGDTVSPVEMYGGGSRTSTSTGDVWHTNVETGSSVTDQAADGTVAGGAIAENVIAAATTNTEEIP